MKPPFPSFTSTWHNDAYPALDPTQPELSQAGKTIIITGAGSGIGRETAISFAAAGAKHIALIGRTESTLLETQELISNGIIKTSVLVCNVADVADVEKVADAIGAWDVLVLNAGYLSPPAPIAQAPLDQYWENYETNVKSIIIAAKCFFPKANKGGAVYAITAGALVMPPKQTMGISGYLCSKIAQIKTMEYLAVENPDMFICSVHPGMIETKVFLSSGATPDMLPMDTAKLPAQFLVWLSQPKTRFLNGRFVWANWDVDELSAKAGEIESSDIMTIGCQGWPYPYM